MIFTCFFSILKIRYNNNSMDKKIELLAKENEILMKEELSND